MIEMLRLHCKFIALKYAARFTDRVDFFVSLLAFFMMQLTSPLFVGVIYYAGGEFPGWSFFDVLFLQGVLAIVLGFSYTMFFGIIWFTEFVVKQGTLDMLLIRPVNTLWLMIMNSFDEEDISRVVAGISITALALQYVEVKGSWLLGFFFAFAGVGFYFGLAIFCSALTIIFIRTRLNEIANIISLFAKYPRTIYSTKLAAVFTFFIPLLLAAHYPASAVLGFPLEYIFESVVALIVFVTLALLFWYRTLHYYSSAGG